MPHILGHRETSRPSTRLFGDRDRVAPDVFSPPDRPEAGPLAALLPEPPFGMQRLDPYAPAAVAEEPLPATPDGPSLVDRLLGVFRQGAEGFGQIPMSSSQVTPGTTLGPTGGQLWGAYEAGTEALGEVPGPLVVQGMSWPFGTSVERNPESEEAVRQFLQGEMSAPELVGLLSEAFRERPGLEQLFLGFAGEIPFMFLGKAATLKRLSQAMVKALRGTTVRGAARAARGALRGEVARQIPTRRPPVGGGAPGVDAAERLAAGPVGDVYTDYTQQQDRFTGFLAHQVPKDTSDHVRRLTTYAPAQKELGALIDEGRKMGGEEWYNTERVRDLWIDSFAELGEEEAHRLFVQAINLVAAASPGSDVQSNIRVGSWASREVGRFGRALGRSRQQALGVGVDERGFDEMLDFLDAVSKGKIKLDTPTGYGRGYGPKGLFKTIKSWASGDWDDPAYIKNPKVRSFAAALQGSRSAVAIDSHLMRILGMVSEDPTPWLAGKQTIGEEAMKGLITKYKGKRVTRLVSSSDKVVYRKIDKKTGKPKLKEGDQYKRIGIGRFYTKTVKSWVGKEGPQKATEFKFNASQAVKSGLVDIEDIRNIPGVYGTSPGKDYGAIAEFITDLAAERGITPAQAQASIWLAAGDRTGVSGLSRGTFVDALRARLFEEAKDRPVLEVIHDWVNNRGLISFLVGLTGGAAAKKAIGTTPSPGTGGGAAREEVMGAAPPEPALGSLTGNGRGPFVDSVFA
jgi:hypothetical protein